ncbi:MAG: hypothetical protein IIC51_05040 [Planctomycetes bacterium]|nr:hypothetical protein [Planctomycetota bacterium]
MTGSRFARRWGLTIRARLTRRSLAVGLLTAFLGGCGALNPAFVDFVAGGQANTFVTLDPAPGHVVIAFINNTEMDEQLIGYLEGPGGLNFTDAEKRSLRPRIRARVLVTFVGGAQARFEFITGTPNVIDQRETAFAVPDLSENDLDNAVVLCNVARVEFLPGSIQVFMPVRLNVYQLQDIGLGFIGNLFRLQAQIPPQFRPLEVDEVDEDGNTILLRNVGIREVPGPVDSPICGTVITISLGGTLSVPFLIGPGVIGNDPSYDGDDEQTEAAIGGQYDFVVTSL